MKATKLNLVETLIITPASPFDFDSTFHKPDHFPSNDTYFEHGISWHTYFWNNRQIGLKFIDIGSTDKPSLRLEIYDSIIPTEVFIKSLKDEIIYRYNLDMDLTEFYTLFNKDPLLKEPLKKFNGMRPGHAGSLYEYLIIGTVLQNTVVRRSVQMLQSLFENYGTLLEYDNKLLWAFWEPGSLENTSEDDLRMLKLGYRAKTIKRLDDAFRNNQIKELDLRSKNSDEQKIALLKLYGVGPATVLYLMHDIFHRYDYFEHVSPWEQKIYSKLIFDKDPEKPVSVDRIIKYFSKYGKYKQLVVHYVWEDLWWKRKNESIPWLEKLIRL